MVDELIFEGVIIAFGYSSVVWTIITMLSSMLHKYNVDIFDKLLCIKCITFWTTLIITQNIFIAAVASFGAYIIDAYIIKKEIEL